MRDSTPLNFNRRLGRPFTMHLERINTSRLLPIEAPPRNGEITKAIYIYVHAVGRPYHDKPYASCTDKVPGTFK